MEIIDGMVFQVEEKGKYNFFNGKEVVVKGVKNGSIHFQIRPDKGKGVMPKELFLSSIKQKKLTEKEE